MSKDLAIWFPYSSISSIWVSTIDNDETKQEFVESILVNQCFRRKHKAIIARVSEVEMNGDEYDFCCYLREHGRWTVRYVEDRFTKKNFSVEANIKGIGLINKSYILDDLSPTNMAAYATKILVKEACCQKSQQCMSDNFDWEKSEARRELQNDFLYIRVMQEGMGYTFHAPSMLFDNYVKE